MKHPTQQVTITLVNQITSSLDIGNLAIAVVFLNLERAFDAVDHTILFDEMHAYGIRINILRWYHSYLTNRSQVVSYDGIQSSIQSIICSHGSKLGPLLFIIHMNETCNNMSGLLITALYADDTSVVIHGKDMLSIIRALTMHYIGFQHAYAYAYVCSATSYW